MFKKLLLLFTIISNCYILQAQSFNQYYADVVADYNADTILQYLQEFEDLGIKEIGTQAQSNTEAWIVDKYTSYGYQDITLDPFTYAGSTTNNVIVKKEGCLYPNKYVIVDGHYDTKNGPGTNDNGSGTAIILEMARILKDVPTDYSILFIHFSGEEDGLFGSTYYVNNTVIPTNMDIKIVFNIDEVGGIAGMTNNTIVCEEDTGTPMANNAASSQMTAELATCVGLYSNLQTEISFAYASDYMPFEENGEIITGFYEKNESPYPHSINDSLSKMDPIYVFEVGKAATGGTLHFAQGVAPTDLTEFACNQFIAPSGNQTWNTSGIFYDTISSVLGCDSILRIDLTIESVNNQIIESNGQLIAQETNAVAYQWLDCDNAFSEVVGETSVSIAQEGNYAVEVTTTNCIDTSACMVLDFTSVDDLNSEGIELYPNPFEDELTVIYSMSQDAVVKLRDINGKEVFQGVLQEGKLTINTSDLSKGVYLLVVEDAVESKEIRVIKN